MQCLVTKGDINYSVYYRHINSIRNLMKKEGYGNEPVFFEYYRHINSIRNLMGYYLYKQKRCKIKLCFFINVKALM